MAAFSTFIRTADLFESELIKYFTCEINGHNPLSPCDRSIIEAIEPDGLTILAHIIGGLYPVINLIFVINIQDSKGQLKVLYNSVRTSYRSRKKSSRVGDEEEMNHYHRHGLEINNT